MINTDMAISAVPVACADGADELNCPGVFSGSVIAFGSSLRYTAGLANLSDESQDGPIARPMLLRGDTR